MPDTAGGMSEKFSDYRGRACTTIVLIRPCVPPSTGDAKQRPFLLFSSEQVIVLLL